MGEYNYVHEMESQRAARINWQLKNKIAVKAHRIVSRAIKKGILIRPMRCQKCGQPYHLPMEAHHRNYEKPLEVLFLCRPCHLKIRKKYTRRP